MSLKLCYGVCRLNNDEIELIAEARQKVLEQKRQSKHIDDELICECMCINLSEIRDFFKDKDIDLEILSTKTGLGSGCTGCLKKSEQWVNRI